jgi:YfiH family protein
MFTSDVCTLVEVSRTELKRHHEGSRMIETTYGDVRLLTFERLSREPGLVHAVTTRPQNYAPHHGVGREDAIRCRQDACRILGVSYDRLTSPTQVFGADVLAVDDLDVGCGRDGRGSAVANVDGLITDRPDVPLILMSADCPLVCVYDAKRKAVGAVHASWKGTVARAAEHLVHRMHAEFGCEPADLLAAICPSAGPCCYEVGRDVLRIARTRLDDADACFVNRDGQMYFDMWAANRRQLIAAGVRPYAIEVAALCSICDDRFWSHRRDGETAGRTALFIGLRS